MYCYGIETKGYRLYDPKREKVFYSCDVQFNELEPCVEKESPEKNTQKYARLGSSYDDEPQCDTLTLFVVQNETGGLTFMENGQISLPRDWLKINSRKLKT